MRLFAFCAAIKWFARGWLPCGISIPKLENGCAGGNVNNRQMHTTHHGHGLLAQEGAHGVLGVAAEAPHTGFGVQ
jgi:hypothetical protein